MRTLRPRAPRSAAAVVAAVSLRAVTRPPQSLTAAAASVAGAGGQDPARWRLLALLRDADRKFQQACDAIAEATELAPGNAGIWETAATLQERAGRFGDAVASVISIRRKISP
jgi:tetratricopeptide (TPR) repeat protein